jgi:multiple sugar transport system ATP-binding protein
VSAIAFEHAGKVFPDGTAAVAELDLRIEDGEFCVLLGSSGCGKSTALRLVAGLETVTEGAVRIGDRVVNDVPPEKRDLAMVFPGGVLYPHLDVGDNIGLFLKLAGPGASEQRAREVKRAAGRVGIGNLLRRRSRELAEGQRQQAALGRAVARRPRAFLMDEPLSHLDASLRTQTRFSIARLHRELGTTMLYVTHDQTEAMALADRIALMRGGRLEQHAAPQELYDRPATLFAAAFTGSPPMNLWHMRVGEEDGELTLTSGRHRLVVPRDVAAQRPALRAHVGRHLILGMRPETLTTARPSAAASALRLPVTRVESVGSHLLVQVEADGAGLQPVDSEPGPLPAEDDDEATAPMFARPAETLTARLAPHTAVEAGDRLQLFLDLGRAHFFDPVTQRAIAR